MGEDWMNPFMKWSRDHEKELEEEKKEKERMEKEKNRNRVVFPEIEKNKNDYYGLDYFMKHNKIERKYHVIIYCNKGCCHESFLTMPEVENYINENKSEEKKVFVIHGECLKLDAKTNKIKRCFEK